jgi:diguanylate cyclase (GGDEF)-like protein
MELKRDHENRELNTPDLIRVVVRRDGVAVQGDKWYYEFVQTNSGRSLFTFLDPETAEEIRAKIEEISDWYGPDALEPDTLIAEFISDMENGLGGCYQNLYLRMEATNLTEEGAPLYQFTIIDLKGIHGVFDKRLKLLGKYRHFMTLKDEIYFDYDRSTNNISVYKYVNGNPVVLFNRDYDEYLAETIPVFSQNDPELSDRMYAFADLVRTSEAPFDHELELIDRSGKVVRGRALGGTPGGQKNLMAGIFFMEDGEHSVPDYMKPAAKDPGTGLLNKRAGTEFAQDKLWSLKGSVAWVAIIDVDDFKAINDNFGHLFGDEVIRFVADTLRTEVGNDGFVSRFGGDEFFVFLERIPTREALKNLLKVISKRLLLHFDPKFKLTISVGVSCYPKDGTTLEELFAKADKGLYIAKEKGKNRHIIYDPELHGLLEDGSMQSQAAAYALSREEARTKMVELVAGIAEHGTKFLTENPTLQRELRTIFDIDGLTIATMFEDRPLVRDGKYIDAAEFIKIQMMDLSYVPRYGNLGRYVANNMLQLRDDNPMAFNIMKEQEIEACILCVYFVDDTPAVFVSFDVFNKIRKWSDREIDMLTEIGALICSTLMREHNAIS